MSRDLVNISITDFHKSPSGWSSAVARGQTDGHEETNASRKRLQ